jgi:hypothetical protein
MPPGERYAGWNGTSIFHMLSVLNGTLICDLGFSMKVLPRHREAAKKALLGLIDYWEKTPMTTIQDDTEKAQKAQAEKFEQMMAKNTKQNRRK